MKAFLKLWFLSWFGIMMYYKIVTGDFMFSLAIKATILLFLFYKIMLFFGRGKKPYRRNNFRV